MLTIKVPATTSNFGVGFDTIGMALNLYNVFGFTKSKENKVIGFSRENTNDNLVLRTYINFCLDHGMKENDIQGVTIHVIDNSIPIARGLGSSATCIIAGAIAANEFNNLNQSTYECARYASNKEGHPDNVFSAVFGGLNATFNHDGKYINETLEVSKNLYFTVLIPSTVGKTEELRSILPQEVSLPDAVYNISRIIQVPTAFQKGDIALLSTVLTDKLHEQYRCAFIPQYDEVKEICTKNNIICLISGSGPTLFLLSDKEVGPLFETLDTFEQRSVSKASGTVWGESK